MKKILFILLLVCINKVNAQYITIADTNFAVALQTNYPTTINGYQLDTTNPAVSSLTYLDVSSRSIKNLNGIQYFTSLTYLDCKNNSLTSLPALPASIITLYCNNNQLT